MIELATPNGLPVRVPEDPAEDVSPHFDFSEREAARGYFRENGYVVVRGVIEPRDCDGIRALWNSEVKPFDGFMYRQTTGAVERHAKNGNGWIMNPILNLQSVSPAHFPQFRRFATMRILANPRLRDVFTTLLGDAPKIVQSMYFEGNSATWEHQDSYYLDSENVGEMCAAWIALEDIKPRAGRFFVCPGSHRLKPDDHSLANNVAENHDAFIASVVDQIRERSLEIRAPVLNKGDVLFWNAFTIHGSLDSQDPGHSRSSITCHAIPASKDFLQHHTRVLKLQTEDIDGTRVFRPKDLASTRNRAIFFVESHFPTPFYWLKKKAIVYLMKRKLRQQSMAAGA
jgi:phytanoyl-CoA hydroxylase